MEAAQVSKKTGATPEVEDGIGGGEVLGVAELKTILVKYRDGHGVEAVRAALVFPDGTTHFIDEKSITKPVQNWLKRGSLKKLGREA